MKNNEENIVRYNLDDFLSGEDLLIETDDYEHKEDTELIDKINLKYFSNLDLNEDIVHQIKYDKRFKKVLLNNVQNRLISIEKSNNLPQFTDLLIIFNLLSLGESFNLFENNKITNIRKLFKEYEYLLKELYVKDKNNFDLTFNNYVTLLDALFILFELNKNHVKRKKTIFALIEDIIESINNLKILAILSPEQICQLSIFQGKLLHTYANVLYITHKKSEDLIDEFTYIIEKQIDGFFIIKNFAENTEEHYDIFLENTSRSIFLLLMKIKKFDDFKYEQLSHIVYYYKQEIKKTTLNSLEDLEKELFSNYSSLYNKNIMLKNNELLRDICTQKNYSIKNLRIFHDIILFDDDFTSSNLVSIFKILLDEKEFKDNAAELLKLKILDVIIHKFCTKKDFSSFLPNASALSIYLENIRNKPYLLDYLSKLHLSLSYYYSLLDKEFLQFSYCEYYFCERLSSYAYVKDENKELYKSILINNAKNHFLSIHVDNNFTHNELLLIGETLMKDFFIQKEVYLKYPNKEEDKNILEKLLKETSINKKKLNKDLSVLIEEKIFFNLISIDIFINQNEIKEKYRLLDTSMLNISYKNTDNEKNKNFEKEIKENKVYLKSRIKDMIFAYLLKIKKPKNYNEFLQINEYVSL